MNIRLFKPFELIVKMMGMPANSEIDPTPLAAITFILVFGLMFGDLGQGLVLAIAGPVLKFIARKKTQRILDMPAASFSPAAFPPPSAEYFMAASSPANILSLPSGFVP